MARKTKQRKRTTPQPDAPPRAIDRRHALKTGTFYGVAGLLAIGGAGWFARDFRSKLLETQLGDIGNGIPTVLQIHDPQCSLCAQLQRQTRKALARFDAGAVQFRVADITTSQGAAASARYGVAHVTLVLLCGRGDVRHIVEGVTPADELARLFARHLRLAA